MGTTAQRLQKPNAQARRHKPKNRPKDCGFEQFGWFGLELMESEAFRAQSANSHRLLDRLVIEHVHHGGVENGQLVVTHDQLREYGLTASSIREAIDECVAFGLIRVKHGGRWTGTNRPNRYRLTWIGWIDDDGFAQYPTNDWKGVTADFIAAWRAERKAKRAAKRGWMSERKTKLTPGFRGTIPLNSVVRVVK